MSGVRGLSFRRFSRLSESLKTFANVIPMRSVPEKLAASLAFEELVEPQKSSWRNLVLKLLFADAFQLSSASHAPAFSQFEPELLPDNL